jgi:hypothetical protein
MYRLLSISVAVVLVNACSAHATFLVDDFEVPVSGAHESDGSTELLGSPNFFGARQMDGDEISNLVINSGGLSGVLAANETAWIEWTLPAGSEEFTDLEFQNFAGTVLTDITYDVTLNGGSISGGAQTFDSAFLRTSTGFINPGDVLRVTFEAGAAGFAVFRADGIQANPEPMSAGLLGLALFGGVCRHRRRRKQVC